MTTTLPQLSADRIPERRWRLGLALALLVFVFTRVRGEFAWYVDLHRQLRSAGVPDAVRACDGSVLLLLASGLAAVIASAPGRAFALLGLSGGVLRGLGFAALAGLPMLLQGWFARTDVRWDASLARGVLMAPLVEEVFYRGCLVGFAVRCGGLRFWPTAIVAGLLFGSVHVPWNASFHAGSFGVLAATTAGGVWYAWLWRRLRWNLWSTIFLHSAMNAAWTVFAVAGDAAGSLWPNVGRALTIAAGTLLAVRLGRSRTGT